MVHHRTTTLHVIPHYKPLQFKETPTMETMTAAEETVLTQTLALLPPLLIFGRTPKCFDTAVWFFLVLALNRRSHIHADLFNSSFLSAIWLSQDQFWVIVKRYFNHPIWTTALLSFFDSKITGNLITMSF